ncbi:hypothetical protein ACFO5R_10930 [Halosolutus amylolyticus]|uniref:Uncharacterized protein n=1 Tax=Halosolutus amylolyticus TaxID=2932267 RepID=A0ABD5PQ19_9EURY|nr:hypothetical protein [Halosolutus amylolyticus]
MSMDDFTPEEMLETRGSQLKTSLPGVVVTTRLTDADVDELEAVHRRQLEYALEHAEEAKEATRM